MSRLAPALAVSCALAASCALATPAQTQCPPPPLPALLNEILYDAIGDDTGLEFVELFNPSPAAVPLAGVKLETGDGSGPGRWTLRWSGAVGDSVPPRGRFVLGGARVTPAPDRVADLDLQNGPDAVRLVWPGGGIEVAGWGSHDFPEYFCGAPAVDAPSGSSLARRPDGVQRGGNAADFEAAIPSPGGANQMSRGVAPVAGSLAVTPERPAVGEPFILAARVANVGAEFLYEGEIGYRVWARGAAGDSSALAEGAADRALSPGDTLALALPLRHEQAGKLRLHLELRVAGGDPGSARRDSLGLRVGPGPLRITEICFRPRSGEPEWVEVRAREALVLRDWRLADDREDPGRVAEPAAEVPADSLALLAQDRPALLRLRPDLDSTRIFQVTPWPALNNSDGAEGHADQVSLREPDGTLCERVGYSAAGVAEGGALERGEDGLWRPVAEGTPLRPPRAPPPMRGRFELEPARWSPGEGRPLLLRYALPWPVARAACELYDLEGRLRARLVPERETGARGEWRLDAPGARGIPPGYYLAVLRARPKSGPETLVERRLLRVEGGAP